jgi:molecular chaperone GrpE
VTEVLADFQRWYEQALAGNGVLPPPAPATADLATLLGHFVALRQEVNLQTRSVRAQQEQTAELFRHVEQELARLEPPPPRAEPSGDEAVQPLLRALVDLYDALSLAGQQIQRVRDTVLPLLDEAVPEADEAMPAAPARSFWSRWFLSPSAAATLPAGQEQQEARQQKVRQAREATYRIRQSIEGLLAGYTMSLERIDRALEQHGLEPIATVGEPFDPEEMEAVDVALDSGRPSGEVVQEVRRGYVYKGRVFRCAQVRVARG